MEITTIINIVLGAGTLGFIATMVKLFVIDKKTSDVNILKLKNEVQKGEIDISQTELEQISVKTKIVGELLKDAETNAETARLVKKANSELQNENQMLKIEVQGSKQVIDYQKDERRDWMEMLKTTLDANAKREKEFDELSRKVGELAKSEKQCQDNVGNLEGRLNILVGILRQNNLEMPEGFVWTNSETNQVYPNGQVHPVK